MFGCVDGAMQWSLTRYVESGIRHQSTLSKTAGFDAVGVEGLMYAWSEAVGPSWPLVLGLIARLLAGSIAYPYIVVRTELQVMSGEILIADKDLLPAEAVLSSGGINNPRQVGARSRLVLLRRRKPTRQARAGSRGVVFTGRCSLDASDQDCGCSSSSSSRPSKRPQV